MSSWTPAEGSCPGWGIPYSRSIASRVTSHCFPGIFDVDAVHQLSVGYRFAQGAFIQAPQLGGVAEGEKPVKRCRDRPSMLEDLVTGQIEVVIQETPYPPASTLTCSKSPEYR